MLSHKLNIKDKELVLDFNGNVISTTVDPIQERLNDIIADQGVWEQNWEKLTLNMQQTQMIDSLGLNLLVSLVKRANSRSASIRTNIKSRIVYQTLLATRMDKQMTIKLEESE